MRLADIDGLSFESIIGKYSTQVDQTFTRRFVFGPDLPGCWGRLRLLQVGKVEYA